MSLATGTNTLSFAPIVGVRELTETKNKEGKTSMTNRELATAIIAEARARFLRSIERVAGQPAGTVAPALGATPDPRIGRVQAVLARGQFGCREGDVRELMEITLGLSIPGPTVAGTGRGATDAKRMGRLRIGQIVGDTCHHRIPRGTLVFSATKAGIVYALGIRDHPYVLAVDRRLPERDAGLAFLGRLETDPGFATWIATFSLASLSAPTPAS